MSKQPFNFKQIPLDDPETWALIQSGRTIGVFQLESKLGQEWASKCKPRNIRELSDVVAICRPGALDSGAAETYAKVKNGKEELSYFHPALEPILNKTYGVLLYQEQSIAICQQIAGFTEVEADLARRAIGSKSTEDMAQVKKMFTEGAAKQGIVTKEEAEEIFRWVEKGQNYLFNASHSASYSMGSYATAYMKTHYPTEFYCSWLTYSHDKPDPKEEIYKLVQDARLHGMTIDPPDLRRMNSDFEIVEHGRVIFGLSHIRGVGEKAIETIRKVYASNFGFREFFGLVKTLKRNVAESLIKSGAVDCFGLPRVQMLKALYVVYGKTKNDKDNIDEHKPLSQVEYDYFTKRWQKGDKIREILQGILDEEVCVKKRRDIIQKKIEVLNSLDQDTSTKNAIWEKLYLGLPLTCSIADDVEKVLRDSIRCIEFYDAKPGEVLTVHCVCDKINRRKTSERSKNPGQEFAYLSVSDSSGAITDCVAWPEVWATVSNEIGEDSVLSIVGKKDNWRSKEQFVCQKIEVIG